MPVKKPYDSSGALASLENSGQNHYEAGGCCRNRSGGMKILWVLIGILVVYAIVFLGTLIRNNLKKFDTIGVADRNERTIVVDGQGKVTVTPDIAMVNLGTISEGKTVDEAQQKNTEVMNKLTAKLKTLGIDGKDIQTVNYNIYPKYDYTDGAQKLIGYQVSQDLTVKIREVSKANQVIAGAGEVGANNVGGLQFTIDDRDAYKAEARALALNKVGEKAKVLARSLGVDLVRVVTYNEYEGGSGADTLYAMGGLAMNQKGMEGAGAPPDIQTGSSEVIMNVNVVFEIR
ncbi:MAG: SIMPL domain-containing protein [Patescibacteria group bacterium]